MSISTQKTLTRLFAPALLFAASLMLPAATARADVGYAVDGYLSNDRNSDCMILREHDGGTRLLSGDIGGLKPGDHVRLYVHSTNGSVCNVRGNAYEVTEVLTLWGDDRHRTTYYDHLTDGSFDNYTGRRNASTPNYRSEVGFNNESLVSLRGRLHDEGRACPYLRTNDGRAWSLVGDLDNFRDNARARVTGWTTTSSRCGGPTLEVRDIRY